jgi:hypothetical protein
VSGEKDYLKTAYQEFCNSYRAIDDFRAKLLGFLPLATWTGIFLLFHNIKSALETATLVFVLGFVCSLINNLKLRKDLLK